MRSSTAHVPKAKNDSCSSTGATGHLPPSDSKKAAPGSAVRRRATTRWGVSRGAAEAGGDLMSEGREGGDMASVPMLLVANKMDLLPHTPTSKNPIDHVIFETWRLQRIDLPVVGSVRDVGRWHNLP